MALRTNVLSVQPDKCETNKCVEIAENQQSNEASKFEISRDTGETL